jgi:phytoene synthase
MTAAQNFERADAYQHCETLLRDRDRDLWLACLFAPAQARPHLHAIHAFAQEISDVRAKVSQPLLGEMRLQWWRDAIEASAEDEGARANPLADALLDTIERCGLSREEVGAFIDAHIFDLYDDPMESLAMLERYCRDTAGASLRWSARALGGPDDPRAVETLDTAGEALALTRLLRALPRHAAAGQLFIPLDLLARHGANAADARAGVATPALLGALKELRDLARKRCAEAKRGASHMGAAQAALLPGATIPLYLDAMERKDYDPFRTAVDPPQWRRQWRLWRAARGDGL